MFPRQSAQSSGGVTTTPSLSTPVVQTSYTTALTSGRLAAPTSGTGSSTPPPAQATTTSSSTQTTSTSPTTSAPPATTSVPSSLTPTSSSSSTPSSSSSVPPPSTTQPAAPSSSQQGIQTTITSSFTVYVSGSPTISETVYQTTIPESSALSSSSTRSAIIGGSAAGGAALLILLLSLAFCARRKRFKRLDFLDRITHERNQAHSRANFLDGEDLDDVDLPRPPRRYTDYEASWGTRESSQRALMAGRERDVGTPPSRWSETGSAFREDVWPSPNEGTHLMDPLAIRGDPDLDLGRIVDDVMGPPRPDMAAHFSDRSVSSMYRGSVAETEGQVHSRTVSNASNAALLEAAGLVGAGSMGPMRSSPLAQSGPQQDGDAS